MSKPWTVWSWDERNHTWLEVAEGTKAEMRAALERKERAAARLMPGVRFTLAKPGEVPTQVPA